MGRDEHATKRGNRHLAQTPKNQVKESDGMDIEFSEELADTEDREAQERSKAAEARVKGK
ncbi:YfhD family protein [Aciduricibacillus chroicocephali]|uniref:YfhD family protein n=1 Tax=Aciduricibacillus chroicocephali TaxID=3054939 RepID=A0ABY9KWQ3_9BACI|nr:YfhD family protein [Bacillaceae bacterium 44XB]